MKNAEAGSITKIIAAVIIGVMLIFMIGIVANGWQNDLDSDNSGDVGVKNDDADNINGDTVEGGTADNITQTQKPSIPKIVSYLTGLEIDVDMENRLPYAFVVEPNAPIYGISNSELTIEIPIENGNTRFVVFNTDTSALGKIGALAHTRNYISTISDFFGGIQVAYGNDDIISYSSSPTTLHIDFSKNLKYAYKENGKNIYTDKDNLQAIASIEGIDNESYKKQNMPFAFCEYYDSVSGNTAAQSILIPYSDSNSTQLVYDSQTSCYLLQKSGKYKVDMLDGKTASYKNVFILFSDMITYELSSGTETIVDVTSGGSGYYISDGRLTEIRWSVDENNNLIFEYLSGEQLVVNRGNSYIGFSKSSELDSVIFE